MSKAKKYGSPSTGFSNRDADRRRGQKGFLRRKDMADNRPPKTHTNSGECYLDNEEIRKMVDEMKCVLEARKENAVYIQGAMKYGCENCGLSWWMFLEKGLEEFGENHKPVPFTIECPVCHGFARDISGICKIGGDEYAELPTGESYFKNDPAHDCGVPVFGRIAEIRRIFCEK